jgi:hypothetical protein
LKNPSAALRRYKNLKFILFLFFVVTASVTFYSKYTKMQPFVEPNPGIDEKFDRKFLAISSCDRLDSLVSYKFNETGHDTAKTVLFIDQFLRNRFYHSYSELSLHDNWLAWLCGKLFWADFLYAVRPCDIIKYPMAACSQQGILFQRQLHRLGIRCSTIQFLPVTKTTSGHYAVSVYYDNSWHYYDSNQEPLIIDSTMPSVDIIVARRLYEKMYVKKSNVRFQEFFRNKTYHRVNSEPFKMGNMHYFQAVTAFLSNWIWLGFLATFVLLFLTKYPKEGI